MMEDRRFTPRRLAIVLLPMALLANCGVLAPASQGVSASDPVETMRVHDGRMSYATQSAAPPPGFAEVAEFRTREMCQARGASGAHMVAAPSAASLHFECTD
jgi:hypothetical protein